MSIQTLRRFVCHFCHVNRFRTKKKVKFRKAYIFFSFSFQRFCPLIFFIRKSKLQLRLWLCLVFRLNNSYPDTGKSKSQSRNCDIIQDKSTGLLHVKISSKEKFDLFLLIYKGSPAEHVLNLQLVKDFTLYVNTGEVKIAMETLGS